MLEEHIDISNNLKNSEKSKTLNSSEISMIFSCLKEDSVKKAVVFEPPKKLFDCAFCQNKFVHKFIRKRHERKCRKSKKECRRERYPYQDTCSEWSVSSGMDFFIYGQNCCQFFLADLITFVLDKNYTPGGGGSILTLIGMRQGGFTPPHNF